MRKGVLAGLLLLSLAANALLLWYPKKVEGATVLETPSAQGDVLALEITAPEMSMSAPADVKNLVHLEERLRDHGFPEEMTERLVVGAVLVEWGGRRQQVKAALDRAVDSGNFAEADRLELEAFAWRRDVEAQLIALGVEVQEVLPWVAFEQQMLPKEWPAETRWQLRRGDQELLLELEQVERARLYGQQISEDLVNRFEELQARMLSSVMEVLPPTQAFEYVIQYGLFAEDTRRDLRHVQMNEEEAQTFFRLTSELFSQSMEGAEVSPEDLLQKFGERFGAERAARLEMEQAQGFREVADVTQRYGLPREIAEEVYLIEKNRATPWTDLFPEDEALVAEKLGAEAYQVYRKHAVESRRSGVNGIW